MAIKPNCQRCYYGGCFDHDRQLAKVLAMLQDVLDQAGGFCMIDVSGVIKAVEDL